MTSIVGFEAIPRNQDADANANTNANHATESGLETDVFIIQGRCVNTDLGPVNRPCEQNQSSKYLCL
jgi:hypothetical protein